MKCEWTLNIDNDKTITFNTIEELENYIIKNNPEYITYAGTKYNFEEITKSLQEIKNESSSNTSGVLKVINKIPGLVQGYDQKAYEEGFKRITLEDLTKKGVNKIQRDSELEKLWTAKQAEIKKSREIGKGIHLVIENLIGIIRNQDYVSNGSYTTAINNTKNKIQLINEKIDNGELEEYADEIRPSLEGLDLNSLTKILNDFRLNVYNPIKSLASEGEDGKPKFWIRTEQTLTAPLGDLYANNKDFDTEGIENIKGKLDIVVIYEDKNTKTLKAKVLDIKTSSSSIAEWDVDRLNTVDVQLEIYKRLLASQGIYENNITTESVILDYKSNRNYSWRCNKCQISYRESINVVLKRYLGDATSIDNVCPSCNKLDIPYVNMMGSVDTPSKTVASHLKTLEKLGEGCSQGYLKNIVDEIVALYRSTLYKINELK